jgi:uncharacterized protein YjbJ (UPF0337 family)
MDWDRIERNWRQFRGAVKAHWTKITDEHLALIDGKRDVLASSIADLYKLTPEQTDRSLAAWLEGLGQRPSALRKRP